MPGHDAGHAAARSPEAPIGVTGRATTLSLLSPGTPGPAGVDDGQTRSVAAPDQRRGDRAARVRDRAGGAGRHRRLAAFGDVLGALNRTPTPAGRPSSRSSTTPSPPRSSGAAAGRPQARDLPPGAPSGPRGRREAAAYRRADLRASPRRARLNRPPVGGEECRPRTAARARRGLRPAGPRADRGNGRLRRRAGRVWPRCGADLQPAM
jgi:hypothetical protein